ncbi:MAG: hypothetical protein ACE5H0_13660 [Bacteroidota bacterium]
MSADKLWLGFCPRCFRMFDIDAVYCAACGQKIQDEPEVIE